MTTLAELRNGANPAYERKQLHVVPPTRSVVRESFILERVSGKTVLDIGASGPMHEAIVQAASQCYGIDREDADGVVGVDLDDFYSEVPRYDDVELIVCGEVIEHLSNPGWFLEKLQSTYPGVPLLITVPNAFMDSGRRSLETGVENCNADHVAYYSWRTLKTLLHRHRYAIREFYYYKGRPLFAEGIVVVAEGIDHGAA